MKNKNKNAKRRLDKKEKCMKTKDLYNLIKSSSSSHGLWFSNMFGAFVATVLGIAVTFGISSFSEQAKNRDIIKASVFNALSDLDNYEDFLKNEDSIFSEICWLPQVIDSYYRKGPIQTDSLSKKINHFLSSRNHFKREFRPIGKDFLSQCQIKNVDDLETFRIINIAYDEALQSYAFLETMKSCVEDLNRVWLSMHYSHNHYSRSDVVNIILSNESAYKLGLTDK